MLFTFPSRYWFAIGLSGVFSLTGWSRRIRAEFLVLRVTQDTTKSCFASITGLSPAMVELSRCVLLTIQVLRRGPTTPYMHCYTCGLGSSPFARHYWGNHYLFSLPGGTKMFQFPPFASPSCDGDNRPSACWVVPFGNPWINGYLHLPTAYRSLSRPSSPPRAKASTRRPNFLSPLLYNILIM